MLSEALAKRIGWQFIDANSSLERYIGRNLNKILGKQGEEAFHQCEIEIISHYIGKEHVVVVLEEAVIAAQSNRKLLSSQYVVYAKVSVSVQFERLPQGRIPLLPIADLKAFLDKQHLERDKSYEETAKLTIDTREMVDVEKDVNKIVKELS